MCYGSCRVYSGRTSGPELSLSFLWRSNWVMGPLNCFVAYFTGFELSLVPEVGLYLLLRNIFSDPTSAQEIVLSVHLLECCFYPMDVYEVHELCLRSIQLA